jgi:hypothetical protein
VEPNPKKELVDLMRTWPHQVQAKERWMTSEGIQFIFFLVDVQ